MTSTKSTACRGSLSLTGRSTSCRTQRADSLADVGRLLRDVRTVRQRTIIEILDRRVRESLGSGAVSRSVLARVARLADGDRDHSRAGGHTQGDAGWAVDDPGPHRRGVYFGGRRGGAMEDDLEAEPAPAGRVRDFGERGAADPEGAV